MKTLDVLVIIWLSVCCLALFIIHVKSHKMIKSIFFNALLGISAIIIINVTQRFTGVFVPLNWYTVGGSSILGLPCVCAVVLLQILM